jgi:ParB family chromosome partitioning protein
VYLLHDGLDQESQWLLKSLSFDAILLESLVATKLESTAVEIRKAGWKWVEIRSTFDHEEWSKYDRVHPTLPSLSPEQQTELDHLQAEHEALWEIEENTEAEEDRIAELAARIRELEDRERVWSPETLANAGVIITLGFDGEADIHKGYVRPEDRREATKAVHENDSPKVKTGSLPASLIESLTAHRSAALNAEFCRRPDVALAALVSSLVAQTFEHGHRDNNALQITLSTSRCIASRVAPRMPLSRTSRANGGPTFRTRRSFSRGV